MSDIKCVVNGIVDFTVYKKFNVVPYYDRINRMATIDIIRRGYLEDFLRDSNSTLMNELNSRSKEQEFLQFFLSIFA